jgi:hypothetical protein
MNTTSDPGGALFDGGLRVRRGVLGAEQVDIKLNQISNSKSVFATRRAAAGIPTGKIFEAWQPEMSSIPGNQQAL